MIRQLFLFVVALLLNMNVYSAMSTKDELTPQATRHVSFAQRMVDYVYKMMDSFSYSKYKLGGTHFDDSRGVYILDCSRYVDYLLEAIHPEAYSSLVSSSGSDQPNSKHYYDFFTGLPDEAQEYWNKVDHVEQLEPGDILVFQYKNSRKTTTGGHVMVVMDKPVRDFDGFLVRVADSARRGHSDDTRERHDSGIGIGTLLLKTNPETGRPSAFAWNVDSYWQRNVSFAMARPVDIYLNRKLV